MKPTRLLTLALVVAFGAAGTGLAQVGANEQLLNPNLATAEELATLPHIGADLAGAIVAGRPFLDMLPLHALLGESLSEAELEATYRTLWVPLNLNTASREEILLVPGAGERMAHEFDEYRPYVALAQFHREIDKYVDDEELARLEQYVFVPMNLNTASSEDFLTIPGVGNRMVHEFEEYRPYVSMEQFRREMGKYVDDGEVARLERYVFIE